MIAFWLAVLGMCALAVQTWLPGLIGKDSGVQVSRPSLLTVAEAASGIVVLQDGVTVSLYDSGMRISDRDGILLDTVVKGSLLSVAQGSVSGSGGRRVEQVTAGASALSVQRVRAEVGRATYVGVLTDKAREFPVTIEVTAARGGPVQVTARAPGAQEIVWHLATDFRVRGYRPALPATGLRNRAWWLKDSGTGADFTSLRGADIAIRPATAQRAVDFRETGRIDVHIWSPNATLVLKRRAPSPDRSAE